MMRTLSAFAAAALIALSAPAQAAESGSFSGSGASQFFGFEIDYAGLLTGSVVSSFSGQSGYDITSVTVDGIAFPDLLPLVGADYFEFKLDVAPGLHTIAIKGLARGGSFVGSYSVVPVPEADAWVMGLAGLGAAGFVVSRRKLRA